MSHDLKKRSDIDSKFKWRLNDLFEDDELWEEGFNKVNSLLEDFKKYRGKLSDMSVLMKCLKDRDKVLEIENRVYVYASMKLHEDSNESKYQGLYSRAESLASKLNSAISFVEPEVLSLDLNALENFINENKEFFVYNHYFHNLMRQKEHILSNDMESLLAEASEIGNAPENIFSMLNDCDMKFGKILDDESKEVELTQGRYISLLESKNQEVRKNAFKTYYKSYLDLKNTLATIYNSSVKKDIFYAKAKKYKSSLDAALSLYNIPEDVYKSLILAIRDNLKNLHRYISLRKQVLNLKEIHMYDLYTPIIKEVNTKISYEEAKSTVLKALNVLGEEYVSIVERSFNEGWIDIYENQGKRSGAYSWGAFGSHPYMLLNFNDKIDDMFTLAHEVGHSIHSYYSWENQAFVNSSYTLFVAEVASTVNEVILTEYLLKNTEDPMMKKYILNYYLEQFRGTVFRQTMFAEFELKTHEMVEKGEALTLDSLCNLYGKLNKEYYGNEVIMDDEINMEWARIPHFYDAFYVYQYSTGFSAAVTLAKGILSGNEKKISSYIEFLKSGGSDYSLNLLKKAGVDMSIKAPVEEALKVFEELVIKMEKEI